MQRINDTRASISQNVEAVGQWRKQLCAFVKANGNHFKHLLNKNGSFQSQHTIHNRLFFRATNGLPLFRVFSIAAI